MEYEEFIERFRKQTEQRVVAFERALDQARLTKKEVEESIAEKTEKTKKSRQRSALNNDLAATMDYTRCENDVAEAVAATMVHTRRRPRGVRGILKQI
ncbi:hypothetical protein ACFLIN_06585 [Corynebacterium kutscheri]|uniref:hypothetical protein n=1 Tax=Corynebacterium kutscheri TaxID=35755 RepID=UPI0037BF537E